VPHPTIFDGRADSEGHVDQSPPLPKMVKERLTPSDTKEG